MVVLVSVNALYRVFCLVKPFVIHVGGKELKSSYFSLSFPFYFLAVPDPQHELQKTDSKVHQLNHTERLSSPHLDRQRSSLKHGGKGGGGTRLAGGSIPKREGSKGRSVRELLRTLAEVHCLHAEVSEHVKRIT